MTERESDAGRNVPNDTHERVREAIERNRNVRNEVREIVVKALDESRLERDDLRQIVRDAMEGALHDAPDTTRETAARIQRVADGIEDALLAFADASRLAAEESGSRIDAFAEQDLKRALDDLQVIEGMVGETVKDLMKSGHETTKIVLGRLARHTSRTGRGVTDAVRDAQDALHNALVSARPLSVSDGLRLARRGASGFAVVMSGILAGMAESLAPTDTATGPGPEHPKPGHETADKKPD